VSSSELVRVELARVARMTGTDVASAREILAGIWLVEITADVLSRAGELATTRARTLDAIRLACALTVGATELLVYDRRLAACRATSPTTRSRRTGTSCT